MIWCDFNSILFNYNMLQIVDYCDTQKNTALMIFFDNKSFQC